MHKLNSSSEELDQIDRNSNNSKKRVSEVNPSSLNNAHNFSIMMTEVNPSNQGFDQDSPVQEEGPQPAQAQPSGFTRQSNGKSDLEKSREAVLQFLMKEENILYKFATEQIDQLQTFINSEEQQEIVDYQLLLDKAQVEKTRVFFFVR